MCLLNRTQSLHLSQVNNITYDTFIIEVNLDGYMFSVVFLQKYGWYIIFGLIALSFVKKNLERHIQVSQFTDIRHFIPIIRSRAHNNKTFSFLAELIQFYWKCQMMIFTRKCFEKPSFILERLHQRLSVFQLGSHSILIPLLTVRLIDYFRHFGNGKKWQA